MKTFRNYLIAIFLAGFGSTAFADLEMHEAAELVDVEFVTRKVKEAICLEQRNEFADNGDTLVLPGLSEIQVLTAPSGTFCVCLSDLNDLETIRNMLFLVRPSVDVMVVYNGNIDGPTTVTWEDNSPEELIFECSPWTLSGFYYESTNDVFVAIDAVSEEIMDAPLVADWFPVQPTVSSSMIVVPEEEEYTRNLKIVIKKKDKWATDNPAKMKEYRQIACVWQDAIDKQRDLWKCGLKTGDCPELLKDERLKDCYDRYLEVIPEICPDEFFVGDPEDGVRKLCPDNPSGKDPKNNPIVVGHMPDCQAGGALVQGACYLPICKCTNASMRNWIYYERRQKKKVNGKWVFKEFCYKSVKICRLKDDKTTEDLVPTAAEKTELETAKDTRQAKWDAWIAIHGDFDADCYEPPFPPPWVCELPDEEDVIE